MFILPHDAAVHFIGVCGAAMAPVAVNLAQNGRIVTGSDSQFYPPMSDALARSRVRLFRGFSPSNIPAKCLVVVGNAVSRGNPELEAALDRNLPLIALPDLINRLYLIGHKPIVVAGTHGKTTTTAMLAHILREAGEKPGWLVGGEPLSLPASCEAAGGEYFVIEGDEYDSVWFDKRPKFLHYRPYYGIINAIEFDHSDIYPDIAAIELAFKRFVAVIPAAGRLLVRAEDERARKVAAGAYCPVETFGFIDEADWLIEEIGTNENRGGEAVITGPDSIEFHLRLGMAGKHNLANGCAAAAMAIGNGIDASVVSCAMETFSGVRRRLEKLFEGGGVVLYDDFAHHPTAITATLKSLRRMHPDRRLFAFFEPRSNTMVRNYLQDYLIEALALADVVEIGPIHRAEKIDPERILDLPKVTCELAARGRKANALRNLEEDLDAAAARILPGDVIVIMTNGAFGGLKERLLEALSHIG